MVPPEKRTKRGAARTRLVVGGIVEQTVRHQKKHGDDAGDYVDADVYQDTAEALLAGSGIDPTLGDVTQVFRVDLDGDGTVDDGFVTDIQTDVRASHRSPLSIGVGAAWHLPRSRIHAAAEWFSTVGAYDVLELQPFVSQETGEPVQRQLRNAAAAVVAYPAAVKHHPGPEASEDNR